MSSAVATSGRPGADPAAAAAPRRRPDPALLAPAALLAVLGGALLSRRQGLWYDELFTAQVAPLPLAEILRAIATGEGTASYLREVPPSYNAPYYVVMHAWLSLTRLPADEVGLRLPSLLAAVAAVAVLGHAVARLAGRRAGVAAGLVAAANPLVLEYAVEARGYGFALLAVSVAALGLARWLTGSSLLLYAVGATAAGLAHWFALPVVGGLALAALVLRRRAALPVVGVSALAGLPPLGLVLLTRVNGVGNSAVGWIRDTGGAVPELSLRAWTGGSAVLLAATVVAVAAGVARGRRAAVVAGAWVGVPVLAVTAAELVRPVFVARYLLPALLGLAVLAALGATGWRRRGVDAAAVTVLVGASLWAAAPLSERGPREDGRGAARLVDALRAPGEVVAAVDRRAALALEQYGSDRLRRDVVLPPADPRPADVVWLVRQSTGERVRASDDDAVLTAGGMRVARTWVLRGTSSDLVVQRWERATP